jgi:HAD superfamily hydrolase (TIGR01484 family)
MDYKAIFADVDGTLISPGSHGNTPATPKVMSAVKKACEKGVIVSLASARSLDWVEGLIDSLQIKGPIILDNGARIYDSRIHQYIFEEFIDNKTAKKVISLMASLHSEIAIVSDDMRKIVDLQNIEQYKKIVKIMVLNISGNDAETLFQLLQKIPDIQISKSISKINPIRESIHVNSVSARKDIALKKCADYLKINTAEIIGIGDSYNDKELLLACGLKAAMGNAVPEIKKIADYIAPSYDEDGVADVIEKYILNSY